MNCIIFNIFCAHLLLSFLVSFSNATKQESPLKIPVPVNFVDKNFYYHKNKGIPTLIIQCKPNVQYNPKKLQQALASFLKLKEDAEPKNLIIQNLCINFEMQNEIRVIVGIYDISDATFLHCLVKKDAFRVSLMNALRKNLNIYPSSLKIFRLNCCAFEECILNLLLSLPKTIQELHFAFIAPPMDVFIFFDDSESDNEEDYSEDYQVPEVPFEESPRILEKITRQSLEKFDNLKIKVFSFILYNQCMTIFANNFKNQSKGTNVTFDFEFDRKVCRKVKEALKEHSTYVNWSKFLID